MLEQAELGESEIAAMARNYMEYSPRKPFCGM